MTFPTIDPILFSLGPLHIRWYGLMYVLGFAASYFLVKKQINDNGDTALAKHFENLNFVLILSVILGGRLGYVLFYNFSYYLHHPLEILATWQGGMSFHGACIALIAAGWIYCRVNKLNFWRSVDTYVVTIPIGLGLGRIGNYINGELYGRVTDLPWGVIFPGGGPWPRHPSQLYEAFLEGFLLFVILWSMRNTTGSGTALRPHGTMLALFLGCYGFFRFIVEFAREPDPQLGYLLGPLTMGQILSIIMIAAGFLIYWFRKAQHSS